MYVCVCDIAADNALLVIELYLGCSHFYFAPPMIVLHMLGEETEQLAQVQSQKSLLGRTCKSDFVQDKHPNRLGHYLHFK